MDSLKVLFVGNSFSEDTVEYMVDIAMALGISAPKVCNLYVGGCSIDMHYANASGDLPVYKLFTNEGGGWHSKDKIRMSEALQGDEWDYIVIQHGTNNGARYTSPECYDRLTPLINYIKEVAAGNPKIAFNLTWMGESTRQHHEIISYKGDVSLMREKLIEVTRDVVLTNPLVDLLIPAGTAIENARTSDIGLLTRDCYHLSMDKGRFIAALTAVASLTGISVDDIAFVPEGVDDYSLKVAIESVNNALKRPLEVTKSKIYK